jgi:hypothetical protein
MIKLKEEYSIEEIEEYLKTNATVLFVGPGIDERSSTVKNKLTEISKIVSLEYNYDINEIRIDVENDRVQRQCKGEEFADFLSSLKQYKVSFREAVLDISSLQGPCIIMLLNALICDMRCRPAKLFTAYVKPDEYILENEKYRFSSVYGKAASIPKMVARARKRETLIPFLGFEGARLSNIIGDSQYEAVYPIIGFPSDDPKWQFETMRYCMDAIIEQKATYNIRKCNSGSVFEAYYLLEEIASKLDTSIVVSPLGTRAHMVAATIFAIKNASRCRIIYDFAKLDNSQTRGVKSIKISHLSMYL